MKYTVEQYEEWINEFCKKKNYTSNIANKLKDRYIYEADILNDDTQVLISVLSDIITDHMCKKLKTYHSVRWTIQHLRHLMDWFYEEKHLITWKPFDDDRLSISVIMSVMRKKNKIKVYSNEDVENIISDVNKTAAYPEIYELLIRLFYEGVPDVGTLGEIRNKDVQDFRITNKDIDMEISGNLYKAIVQYRKIDEMDFDQKILLDSVDDRLIKTPHYVNTVPVFDKRKFQINIASNYFNRKISKPLEFKVTPRDLYISGFLNYFKKETKYNDIVFYDTFVNVVEERANKYLMAQLSDILFKYNGIRRFGYQIRNDFSLYVQ